MGEAEEEGRTRRKEEEGGGGGGGVGNVAAVLPQFFFRADSLLSQFCLLSASMESAFEEGWDMDASTTVPSSEAGATTSDGGGVPAKKGRKDRQPHSFLFYIEASALRLAS